MQIDPRQHDRFVMRQRWRLIVNQYEFFLPDDESTPFCFVEQARFKWKEEIRFYTDASKTQELIRIKARQRFDPWATYDVVNAHGQPLGEIRKEFGHSLFRSRYTIVDAAGNPPIVAQEQSVAMALTRRFIHLPAQLIPIVGDIVSQLMDWLPFPYHFEFHRGPELIGVNRRRLGKLIDVYDIDFTADANRVFDRWLVIAMCVGMDALQAR